MYMMYDHPLGAHRGAGTMAQKIRERYYWETVYQDCKEHVKTCRECQFQGSAKKNNELHPIPVGGPWDRIGIDIVGPLPVTERGNRYIVTCIDYMTKWAEAKPLPDKSARQVAWFLYEEIICRYGCPQIIQSDNGLEFVNEVVKELLKQFQIWHQTVSPYRPQANGMIERFNRTLGEALSKLEEVYDWDKFVRPTLMAYNTSRQNSTKMTPYFLMYGRTAKLPLEEEVLSKNTLLDRVITMIHKLPIFRESARIAIKRAQEKMRHEYPVQQSTKFQVGDQVLYDDSPNYHTKLEKKWVGPWTIIEVLYNGTYKVADHMGVRKQPINGDHLKEYHERTEPRVIISELI